MPKVRFALVVLLVLAVALSACAKPRRPPRRNRPKHRLRPRLPLRPPRRRSPKLPRAAS